MENLYFRGESRKYETSCKPTIFRVAFTSAGDEKDYYDACYSEIKKIKTFRIKRKKEFTYIKKLTLMQHYGLNTRLLDLTKSSNIAHYFACSKDFKEDGFIYQFDIEEGDKVKSDATTRIKRKIEILRHYNEIRNKGISNYFGNIKFATIEKNTVIDYTDVLKVDPENIRYKNQEGSMMLFGFKIIDNKPTYEYSEPHISDIKEVSKNEKYKILKELCINHGICFVYIYPDCDLSLKLIQQHVLFNHINSEFDDVISERVKKLDGIKKYSEGIIDCLKKYKKNIISDKNLFYFLMVETLNYLIEIINNVNTEEIEKIIKKTVKDFSNAK